LAYDVSSSDLLRVRDCDPVTFVRYHENAAIGTILGAQTAPDAVVFDNDLQVLASMNGVNRTSDHAMWVGAGPTGGGDEEVIEASSGAKEARDWNAVCLGAVLLDTTPGTGVAAGAVIKVEHENALTFIEALFDILIEHPVTYRRTV
jgi:hypothetical protein